MKILAMIQRVFVVLIVSVAPVYAGTLAVINGTVIDGTGAAPVKNAVVVIENGRIANLGSKRGVTVPEGAEIIDAKGKYIIPGLMDANVHLYLNIDVESLIKYEGRYDDLVLEASQFALKAGVTTVFDTWGPTPDLIKTRDAINRGEKVGSRIFLAGNIIGYDGPFSKDYLAGIIGPIQPIISNAFISRTEARWQQEVGRELMWMTPEEVFERVAEYTTSGVDFLKYGASGHIDFFFIQFSPRAQKAIVDAGHKAGMTVQAHTTSVESYYMAVEAGVDILTHCDITGPMRALPENYVKMAVEKGAACSVTPSTKRRMAALEKVSPALTARNRINQQNLRTMIDAGATLLLATDAGVKNPVYMAQFAHLTVDVDDPEVLGEANFNALVGFEDLGMAPMEILKTATSNIAKAYKLDDHLGTLEAGKVADMVILDKNPLKSARNYRSIYRVIKDGEVVDIDALPLEPVVSHLKP